MPNPVISFDIFQQEFSYCGLPKDIPDNWFLPLGTIYNIQGYTQHFALPLDIKTDQNILLAHIEIYLTFPFEFNTGSVNLLKCDASIAFFRYDHSKVKYVQAGKWKIAYRDDLSLFYQFSYIYSTAKERLYDYLVKLFKSKKFQKRYGTVEQIRLTGT